MKALRIHRPAGPEGLVYEDAPNPEPATGDVLVEVRASGFTPPELTWPSTWVDRAGRERTPSVPGNEVSGVVVAAGFGTTGFEVGDEVFGLTDSYRDGACAEHVAMEARNLALKPGSIDHVQAASLSQTGLSAWQALFTHGQLQAGQTVVIHGAGGAVGTVAAQLARDAGARVIGTGRASVREIALDHGVHEFVDLDSEQFEDAAPSVDLVLDTIGGDVLDRSTRVVRPAGALISLVVPPPALPGEGRSLFFVLEPDRTQLLELAALADAGRLRPSVSAVYPLADGREAFEAKARGDFIGKVVLQP